MSQKIFESRPSHVLGGKKENDDDDDEEEEIFDTFLSAPPSSRRRRFIIIIFCFSKFLSRAQSNRLNRCMASLSHL